MRLTATIAISNSTREILKGIGHKGQTYDQLILDLVRFKQEPKDMNLITPEKKNSRRIEAK